MTDDCIVLEINEMQRYVGFIQIIVVITIVLGTAQLQEYLVEFKPMDCVLKLGDIQLENNGTAVTV